MAEATQTKQEQRKNYRQENECRIVGNLVRDADENYRQTNSGTDVVNFTIAQNGLNDEVNYVDVVAFGKTAVAVANYKKKGDEVRVLGRLANNNYTDNEGTKHYKMRLIANRVEFLRNAKGSAGSAGAEANADGSEEDFDDIPEFGAKAA